MSTRSILGLVYALEGLRAIGEDPDPVLARHGLDPRRLDPAAEIDRGLELRIYTELAENLRDPLAGLKAGAYFSLTGYGPFTMLLMTSRNAWHAFQTGVKYRELTYVFSELALQPGQGYSALELRPIPLPPQAYRFRVDGEMSGTYQLALDLEKNLNLKMRPKSVEFCYPEPPEKTAYEEHFGCPVLFGSDACRFWINNDYLSAPFPTANETAHEMYRAQCDQLLAQRRESGEDLTGQVRRYLEMFRGDFPGAEDAARLAGLSERGFRRRLSEKGTSFRALLDEVRFRKACEFLRESDKPVDELARQLGYAETGAFIHAFRRWSGMTPAAWRRAHKNAG